MIAFATLVVATGLTVALGALVRRMAPTMGAVVPPRADRWHNRPTPTMGGVAFAAGTVLPLAAGGARGVTDPTRVWLPGVLAAAAVFVVGVLDDRLPLPPLPQLRPPPLIRAFLVFA